MLTINYMVNETASIGISYIQFFLEAVICNLIAFQAKIHPWDVSAWHSLATSHLLQASPENASLNKTLQNCQISDDMGRGSVFFSQIYDRTRLYKRLITIRVKASSSCREFQSHSRDTIPDSSQQQLQFFSDFEAVCFRKLLSYYVSEQFLFFNYRLIERFQIMDRRGDSTNYAAPPSGTRGRNN